MRATLALTSSLLLGMALLMLGAGLQGTLLGVRATLEGFPTIVIGAVMTAYYLGYLGGSIAAPALVARVGHIRVFAALAALASAAILLQSLFVSPWPWALLRGASGLCFAGIYVVAESWLNDRADNRTRGALLAIYMVVIYLGLGLGQFLLGLADPASSDLFILVAVLISVAVVPMALSAQHAPEFSLPQRVRLRELFAISPLGVVAVVSSGAIGGTLFSLGPVYAANAGFTTFGIAAFMSLSILAAVATQLPVGRWSDRFDRRVVIVSISTLSAAAAVAASLLRETSTPLFFLATAAYGGFALTIYSLSVSHINDHLRASQMVAASGTIILVNGAGAALGPLAAGAAMQAAGPEAYFGFLAAVHAALAFYALWRKGRRAAVPSEDKARFVGAQPQAVPTGRLAAGARAAGEAANPP
jgi:MFS family permease